MLYNIYSYESYDWCAKCRSYRSKSTKNCHDYSSQVFAQLNINDIHLKVESRDIYINIGDIIGLLDESIFDGPYFV